jgi:NADH-quinone oxidoreductase subunit M
MFAAVPTFAALLPSFVPSFLRASEATETVAGFPLLSMLVILPAVAAALLLLVPKTREEIIRPFGIVATSIVGALSIYLFFQFDKTDPGFQFVSLHPWIRSLGASWHLGVDGISLLLVVLTGILFPIALLGPQEDHDIKQYTAWLLLLEAGVMGTFLSLDLFLFFVCFEIVLVPMYFLINGWGHGERKTYSAMKFFLYTMFGSAFLLVATLALVYLNRDATGVTTFNVVELAHNGSFSMAEGRWMFAAFALAFCIKVPVFPLHTWLPDAHTDAPTAGSVILAGVLLKMGTYGLLRFCLYLFPEASRWAAPVLLTLGVIGIIYGALAAIVQKDLKRLVAYSSVAHLGFIVVGIFAMTRQGLTGGVLQMINHGVSTPALFLLIGWIYERRHTREIAALKGIQKVAPVMAGVFTIVMMSSIGVPGLNGFAGEFLILVGTFISRPVWAIVAASGVILAALYLLWAYQRSFHGEPDEASKGMADLTFRERLTIAPLLLLIIGMGVYPKPFLERIEPSVKELLSHMSQHKEAAESKLSSGEGYIAPKGDNKPKGHAEGEGGAEGEDHSEEKPAASVDGKVTGTTVAGHSDEAQADGTHK